MAETGPGKLSAPLFPFLERVTGRLMPNRGKTLALLVALSVVLSFARLWNNPPTMLDDQTADWWPVSMNLLDGKGYSICLPRYFPCNEAAPPATGMREPVPVLIFAGWAAITGRSLLFAALLQAVMSLFTALLIRNAVTRLATPEAGLWAAFLWVFYLPALQVLPEISGDLVAALLVALTMHSYSLACRSGKLRDQLLIGLFLGLAVLSRSALLMLVPPLFIGLFMIIRRSGSLKAAVGRVAAIGAVFTLVLLPWVIRQQRVFGRPLIGSTLTGYNLLRHSGQLGSPGAFRFVGWEEGTRRAMEVLARHPELPPHANEAQVDAVYLAEGKAIVKAHPVGYLALCAYRFLPLWFNIGVLKAYAVTPTPMDALIGIQQGLLLVLIILGLRGGPRLWRPLWFGVLLFCLAYMALVCRLRYLIPVMPILLATAAMGLLKLTGTSTGPGYSGRSR